MIVPNIYIYLYIYIYTYNVGKSKKILNQVKLGWNLSPVAQLKEGDPRLRQIARQIAQELAR